MSDVVSTKERASIAFRDAVPVWFRIGLLSFGGPAGQIALMHKELVEKRKWIGEQRYLHALNYCMLLPGPEATQLATYVGWLLHGTRGGLVAGSLFVLPGAVLLLVLSAVYAQFHDVTVIAGLFFGMKAAVLALVAEALIRIGKRALTGRFHRAIALCSFVALALFAVPFPIVVASAALIGALVTRFRPSWLPAKSGRDAADDHDNVVDAMEKRGELAHTKASRARFVRTTIACVAVWLAPVAAFIAVRGVDDVLAREGVFFSEAAVVTFGGAYAVLSWVGQRAVALSWLTPKEMLDGLALAETTPGPLILVLEFVAFVAAYKNVPGVPPLVAGVVGAALMLWTTFIPAMSFVLIGAPYVEAARGKRVLDGALATITAAVVGVIANLSVFLAVHALFAVVDDVHLGPLHVAIPDVTSLDPWLLALTALAFALLFPLKQGLARALAICGVLGAVVVFLR